MKAMRESHNLKGNARFLAFEAHIQMGLTYAELNPKGQHEQVPFGQIKRELTPEYLAMFTGLTEKTVRTSMDKACRLGFFRRVDNGKGGRNNSNRATYMAVVPAWT